LDFKITPGFTDEERGRVAALYWEAFSAKLSRVMGPDAKALDFITAQLDPNFALVARGTHGQILGIAGFKTSQGALIGGELGDLARTYGWLSTLWRAPILALVERELTDDILLMDGICVAAQARGLGLGSALLDAILATARKRGLSAVRLDVISTNPRAKALYERVGFEAIGQEHLGPLRLIFGFGSATKVICPLSVGSAEIN
jgi:ribosomal protein S18 acetylase RimI-like enzyme